MWLLPIGHSAGVMGYQIVFSFYNTETNKTVENRQRERFRKIPKKFNNIVSLFPIRKFFERYCFRHSYIPM